MKKCLYIYWYINTYIKLQSLINTDNQEVVQWISKLIEFTSILCHHPGSHPVIKFSVCQQIIIIVLILNFIGAFSVCLLYIVLASTFFQPIFVSAFLFLIHKQNKLFAIDFMRLIYVNYMCMYICKTLHCMTYFIMNE